MSETFEQRLLAYLDGMLDARARHEFLAEVARDPHKQKLLKQFRELDSRLRDRGHPIAVPLRAQQALAQRIPSLRDAVPSTPLPPAASTGNAAAGRIAATVFGTGRRIIGLAVIGGLLAVGVSLLAPSNDAGLPANPDEREAAVLPTAPLPHVSSELSPAMAPSDGTIHGGRSASGHAVVRSSGMGAARHSPSEMAVFPDDAAATNETHVARPRFEEGPTPPVRSLLTDDMRMPGDGRENSTSLFSASTPPGMVFSSASLPALFAGRLHLYLESGATSLAATAGSGTESLPVSGVYLAGLRYRLSEHFSAGLDLGRSRFTRERLSARSGPIGDPGGGTVIVIDRERQTATHPWLRLHGVYTFNPDARLRFEADAGSGVLLAGDNPVMLSTGLSAVYVFSTALQLRAGLHGSGAWMSPGTPLLPELDAGNGVIGIIRRADGAERRFTVSMDFRIGVGIYLW